MEELLTTFTYFLRIKISTLEDLIEYQFYLYKNYNSSETGNSTNVGIWNVLEPVRTINFFLDPRNPKYLEEFSIKIRSLFPVVNFIPESDLRVNGVSTSNQNYFSFITESSVELDARFINDFDTRKNDITLNWRQIDLNGRIEVPDSLKIELNNSPVQKIRFTKEGNYKIGLSLFDGISFSKEDTVNIEIVRQPKITIKWHFKILQDFYLHLKISPPFLRKNKIWGSDSIYVFSNIPSHRISDFVVLSVKDTTSKIITIYDDLPNFNKYQDDYIWKLSEIKASSTDFNQSHYDGTSSLKLSIRSRGLPKDIERIYKIQMIDDKGNKSNIETIKIPFLTQSLLDIGFERALVRTKITGKPIDSLLRMNTGRKFNSVKGISVGLNFNRFNLGFTFWEKEFIPLSNLHKLKLRAEYGLYFNQNNTYHSRLSGTIGIVNNRYSYYVNDELINKISRINFSLKIAYRFFKIKYLPLRLEVLLSTSDRFILDENSKLKLNFSSIGIIYNVGGI